MDSVPVHEHVSSTPEQGTVATRFFTFGEQPADRMTLQNGGTFGPVTLAYETYGALSPARDNAILVFHALSGSQHAAGFNPEVPGVGDRWTEECRIGWWDDFIGPGRAFDTDRFYVICANYLGGCYGSTGPASIDPATGRPYGGSFPMITISDIVDSQICLLDELGIRTLRAVTGASIGGMLSANLAVRHPDRVRLVIPISSSLTPSILQRVHNFEQIYAIEEDPLYRGGDYYDGPAPHKGLALARMIAHKSYISLKTIADRARSEIVHRESDMQRYDLTLPVESYMLHQGQKFVHRFDANSYLRIVAAWQYFDLLKDAGAADYGELFARCRDQRYLIFSIDTDVCFYPEEQAEMVQVLKDCHIPCEHVTIRSDKGHDAFLLEHDQFKPHLQFALTEG